MKLVELILIGSLGTLITACHIDVDDYCDDDHDWDDDDQPCETHVHADTTGGATGGSPGSGTQSTDGSHSSSGGSGVGTDSSSGNATSGSTGSGGSAGSGTGGSTSVSSGGSGGSAGASGDGSGGSAGASGDGSGGAYCSDCTEPSAPTSCLVGSITKDACCSADVLIEAAAEDCTDYGLDLANVTLEQSCESGHHQVSYQCCREQAPQCVKQAVTLDACAKETTLMVLAEELCADVGSVVSSAALGGSCDDGTYQSVTATCCAAE